MRRNTKNLVLTGILIITASVLQQAYAQESDMQRSASTKDEYLHKDGVSRMQSHEAKIVKEEVQLSDGTSPDSVQVIANSKPIEQGEKTGQNAESDDLVSFNFLYYIIQRYKMADMVDK